MTRAQLARAVARIPRTIERKEAAAFDLAAEIKTLKDEITAKIAAGAKDLGKLQAQVDEIDKKLAGGNPGVPFNANTKSMETFLKENDNVQRLLKDKRGRCIVNIGAEDMPLFERKTTITSSAVGYAQTGVLQIERLPGITREPQQQLFVRDLLTANPTTFAVIDFVKVSTPLSIASPVPEASLKPENQLNFVSVSERVRTIATWIPASRQILDDMAELMSFLRVNMPYYVDLMEEQQLLTGDGTGENLHGLIPQASAFNNGLLVPKNGWNKIDVIGRAIEQITAAKELAPTFAVLNPSDWWDIRLTKDQFGRYLLGDPMQSMATMGFGSIAPIPNMFGLQVVATTSMAPGTFLIGSGNPLATEIRDRLEMQIDISTEHMDFFIKNLLAVRAEKRLALITRRPASFVTGSFTTSP
jgi:HK97 family phage major capsid protein